MKLDEFNSKHNHKSTEERFYKSPTDLNVLESLKTFQDRKFGLMVHWGLYSQLGIVESWALPDADRDWAWGHCDRFQHMTCREFRKMYEDLQTTFNPSELNPKQWAKIAKDTGFKYFLFTTKHHDGFCMWDTKYTDFKITSEKSPYKTSENADICKSLFNAFREENIAVHAYFSKPDWHSEYFWTNGYDTDEKLSRFPNYNPFFRRKIWKKFVEYTRNQMLELVSNYGRIEALWLDGGQVRPSRGMNLHLADIISDARKIQPWLMVADRTVGGRNENFITPEQSVPSHPILIPWESCITLGETFSYTPNDKYKSASQVVHLLCNIVAKGGNLALNVAPDSKGNLPSKAVEVLGEIGKWMSKNGYAIYATRPIFPYSFDKFVYTAKGNETFAICLTQSGEKVDGVELLSKRTVKSVKFEGQELPFSQNGNKVNVGLKINSATDFAYVLTLDCAE